MPLNLRLPSMKSNRGAVARMKDRDAAIMAYAAQHPTFSADELLAHLGSKHPEMVAKPAQQLNVRVCLVDLTGLGWLYRIRGAGGVKYSLTDPKPIHTFGGVDSRVNNVKPVNTFCASGGPVSMTGFTPSSVTPA
mgnify:CR=1 FL=1